MIKFHPLPPDAALIIAPLTLAIFALVKLNLWSYRRRKKMKPEERQREDEAARFPGDW